MKLFVFLVLCLITINSIFSQRTPLVEIFTDFSNSHPALEIDTSQTNNLWEIGESGKNLFNNPYSAPQSICTRLDSNYTLNNYSSFQLTIVSDYFGTGLLEFYHKYDTDKGNAGGYIETSYDNGKSWSNLVNEGNWREGFYNSDDLIFGHTPAFSGRLENWEKVSFNFLWYALVKKYDRWPGGWGLNHYDNPDTLKLRFNFQSNNIAAEKEGWVIDDIRFQVWDIAGSVETNSLKVYRIHYISSDRLIQVVSNKNIDYSVTVYDLTGRKVLNVLNSPEYIPVQNLDPGIYMITIVSDTNTVQTEKILIY